MSCMFHASQRIPRQVNMVLIGLLTYPQTHQELKRQDFKCSTAAPSGAQWLCALQDLFIFGRSLEVDRLDSGLLPGFFSELGDLVRPLDSRQKKQERILSSDLPIFKTLDTKKTMNFMPLISVALLQWYSECLPAFFIILISSCQD